MEGTAHILRRFVRATVIISVLLLIVNFGLLALWVFNGMDKGQSPGVVVQRVAEGLRPSAGGYVLDDEAAEMLKRSQAWAMLLDEDGKVEWEHSLPEELPKSYSLVDVSRFTRHFLMDYPVFVWTRDAELVVVGYPKGSLVKYLYILPANWVASLPLKALGLMAGNIALALLLSLFIGSLLIRSIRPLMQAIQHLAEGREVHVEPKGVLAHLARSLNRASRLLQQKSESLKMRDEARSNWIAGISHDSRTPLSMILGYASDLEDNSALPAEQRRQAGIIRQQAEKLKTLIHDLNLVSMLEYEMQPLHKKTIRLSALARQIVSDFLNNGLDERFSLELEVQDEKARVCGDERLLTRAVANLIQNSVRHNPDGCRIQLLTGWHEGEDACRVVVADDGKGIAREELADLVELPYSAKRKRPRHNGHGLGLPMVARIARAHQGSLLLDSDTGKGFRAELVLPAATGAIATEAAETEAVAAE